MLSDIDAPIVATICRRLDGIALAIELAASHVGSLGIPGVAELLDNRFGLIWHGRRTALPRHQTMNAMLDWSYNLLSRNEQAVLDRLSVFVGIQFEAARSVASERRQTTKCYRGHASLLAKSLISTSPLHGSTYYRLLVRRGPLPAKLAERGKPIELLGGMRAFFPIFSSTTSSFNRGLASTTFLDTPSYRQRTDGTPMGILRQGDATVGVELTTRRRRYLSDCRYSRSAVAGVNGRFLGWTMSPVARDRK